MFINLNPGALGLTHTPFETLVALAPAHGFGGIDLTASCLASIDHALTARKRLEDSGLQWGLAPLPCDFLQIDDQGFEAGLETLKRQLPFIEATGCTRAYNHVWPGSNKRDFAENFEWHVKRLDRLAALLASVGVRLGIEFLGPLTLQNQFRFPFLRDLRGAITLTESVSTPVGIVLDCFHWHCSEGAINDLESLLRGQTIINVHANDAVPGRPTAEQLDLDRRLPLESRVIDAPGVMRVLRRLNYDGPVIAEPFRPHLDRFSQMPAEAVLREVGAIMRRLLPA